MLTKLSSLLLRFLVYEVREKENQKSYLSLRTAYRSAKKQEKDN